MYQNVLITNLISLYWDNKQILWKLVHKIVKLLSGALCYIAHLHTSYDVQMHVNAFLNIPLY